jgi:multidrug resistance efflux pump
MQLGRAWLILAAGAAAVFFINNQSIAVFVSGRTARATLQGGTFQQASADCSQRIIRTEARIDLLEKRLDRSRRELRSARAALIIARYDSLREDLVADEE